MATRTKEEVISIKPVKTSRVKVRIVGDSPLIVHAWSEKAKKEMLDKQMGLSATKKRPTKYPFDDFARALYWLTPMPTTEIIDNDEPREIVTEELFDQAVKDGARFGFPANAFKVAGNAGAYRAGMVKNQMVLRSSYFIFPEDSGEYVEIKGDKPLIREDTVTVGMGSSDLRYRPMFNNWYCDMIVEYRIDGQMKLNDILNCINTGGFGVGVGEWRPEKDGFYGRFHCEVVK